MGVKGKEVEYGGNLHGWGDHIPLRRCRNGWEDNKINFKVVK
jgi:hypothetical protein